MNLLFDLDGTLADPLEAFAGSLDFAYDSLRLPRLSREVMRTLIGPPLHLALPKLLGTGRESLAPEVMRLYRRHHGESGRESGIYHYRFYEGMDEALRSLKARNRLFVATSKPKVYADTILRHFGKEGYFEFVYGSELSGINSKKGELIRFALRESQLDAAETVMIGDREHDVFGARENGVRSIGVAWGYGSVEELTRAGTGALARSWEELMGFLGASGSRLMS